MPRHPNRLIIFVKAPLPGHVKTRLARSVGKRQALRLYKCFVADIMATMAPLTPHGSTDFEIVIGFTPREEASRVKTWIGSNYSYFAQQGPDLGARMDNAFKDQFDQGLQKAVLIGTDVPDMPRSIVIEAFHALTDNDAVIGPSEDGGYYLIGFKAACYSPLPFQKIAWSSNVVYEQTKACLENLGYRIFISPKRRDIDQMGDLRYFARKVEGTHSAPHTQACLEALEIPDIK